MSFKLESNIAAVTANLERRASELVRATALQIEAAAKISMTGPKSGREYRRGKKTHQASGPGEAPAVDTGNLMNSIQTTVESPMRAVVSVNAEYGVWLEFGTVHIAPRPFLGPAFEQAKPIFEAGLRGLLK